VDAGHHQVEPGQQLLLLVERPVVEDVDLDPREDPELGLAGVGLGRQLVVGPRHLVELGPQPLRAEPVGHGQPGGVVGEHDVLVTEGPGRPRHRLDGGTAVAPQRVGVAVAPEGGEDLRPLAHGDTGALLQAGDVRRDGP
jgi:hypothetical protein